MERSISRYIIKGVFSLDPRPRGGDNRNAGVTIQLEFTLAKVGAGMTLFINYS